MSTRKTDQNRVQRCVLPTQNAMLCGTCHVRVRSVASLEKRSIWDEPSAVTCTIWEQVVLQTWNMSRKPLRWLASFSRTSSHDTRKQLKELPPSSCAIGWTSTDIDCAIFAVPSLCACGASPRINGLLLPLTKRYQKHQMHYRFSASWQGSCEKS